MLTHTLRISKWKTTPPAAYVSVNYCLNIYVVLVINTWANMTAGATEEHREFLRLEVCECRLHASVRSEYF